MEDACRRRAEAQRALRLAAAGVRSGGLSPAYWDALQDKLEFLQMDLDALRDPSRPWAQGRPRGVGKPIWELRRTAGTLEKIAASGVPREERRLLKDLARSLGALRDSLQNVVSRWGPQTRLQRELRRLLRKSGLSAHALAGKARVDPSYVRKLLEGTRRPSRGMVVTLTDVLVEDGLVSRADADRLMKAAGHRPSRRR